MNLVAQQEQHEMMMKQAEVHRETIKKESKVVWKGSGQNMKGR